MNAVLLDHRGEPLTRSEPTSLRRVVARYDAAQTTVDDDAWWANADSLGPNSALSPYVRRIVRDRARYECDNNPYASGMLTTLANDTIGTGPELQITDPSLTPDLAQEIQDQFWSWCLAVNLPSKLQTMRMSKCRDGETFAVLGRNRGLDHPVRVDFKPIEAELVSNPALDLSPNSLLDGVVLDDFGNVIGYQVLKEHPNENIMTVGGLEADFFPARDVIHLYRCVRPGQFRGISEMVSSLRLYAQLRRYTLATLRAAESAALLSWIIESAMNPEQISPLDPMDTVQTARGMGMTLPAGWRVSQLKAEQPVSTYPQFKREIISEIARCLGMPYNVAAGDSSGYNYSSGRLDHRTYYKSLRVERASWERTCLDVLFARWWQQAAITPGYFRIQFDERRPPKHEWRWDGDEHVDPTKEVTAAGDRIRTGLTSFADECARLGTDPLVVQRKNAETLGMSVEQYRSLLVSSLFNVTPPAQQQEIDDAEDQ